MRDKSESPQSRPSERIATSGATDGEKGASLLPGKLNIKTGPLLLTFWYLVFFDLLFFGCFRCFYLIWTSAYSLLLKFFWVLAGGPHQASLSLPSANLQLRHWLWRSRESNHMRTLNAGLLNVTKVLVCSRTLLILMRFSQPDPVTSIPQNAAPGDRCSAFPP